MKNLIIKIGTLKTIVIITIFSIFTSIFITSIVFHIFGQQLNMPVLAASIIAPGFIAPAVSYFIVNLLFRIHHLEVEQRRFATYDSLTGVLARRMFIQNCKLTIDQHKRTNKPVSVAYIDIDDFKMINDTFGHKAGDLVLKSFGNILSGNLRESDIAGRVGGEEFSVALPNTEVDKAALVFEKVFKKLNETNIVISGKNISYTVSIGISSFNKNNIVNIEELLSQSDKALYRAKARGKNLIEIYNPNWSSD